MRADSVPGLAGAVGIGRGMRPCERSVVFPQWGQTPGTPTPPAMWGWILMFLLSGGSNIPQISCAALSLSLSLSHTHTHTHTLALGGHKAHTSSSRPQGFLSVETHTTRT